ncbi:MAG: pyridoxal phosphate-dependent aminotransferase [Lachnospiraceae bacterium]|nr:pyridoxal phosphate-dependent aminotransferase [Lachnospiraceae bacterium]
MLNEQYKNMLNAKNVIRELSEYATARGKEIGYENVFDFSLGNPSLAVPDSFTKKMIELMQTKDSLTLHGYTPTLGNALYKTKIAESLNRRYGMQYKPEHIFPATGAAGAVAHAVRAVSKPGDEIAVIAPFFSEYRPYIEGAGCSISIAEADTERFQINFEALDKVIGKQTAAVLINTPNNPSGTVYSEDTLKELASILERKSAEKGDTIFLISDEPYRDIRFDNIRVPYVSQYYPHTLSCYSFAKSMSIPGERIGYVAVHPACEGAEYIVPMCGQISRGLGHNCPPSIIMQAVAETCDDTSDLSVYETNMNIIYDTLKKNGFTCVRPGGTFYIFPKALEEDAVAFCKKATKYDLILVPSDSFGVKGFFRMAYGVDTEKVKRAMPRLEQFVKETYGQ